MSDIKVDVQSAPTTPSTGQSIIYVDTTTKSLTTKNDAGFNSGAITNYSTVSQALVAGNQTYLVGSNLAMGTNKVQIGTMFRWKFNMTKTAAGIATSSFSILVGTTGTVADVARVSFTKPAGTAAIDEGYVEIIATCRGPLSASGVLVGEFTLVHNLASTGHAVIPCVCINTISSGFDVTTAGLIFGLSATTGASDVITIQMVQSEAINV